LVLAAACGGGHDQKRQPHAGASGKGVAESDGGAQEQTLVCGSKTCRLPAGGSVELCCMDPFAGMCGTLIGGTCQRARSMGAEKCPLPQNTVLAIAGNTGARGLSTCCAANGECGLDLDIGFGCTPDRDICGQLPREYVGDLVVMSCDGEVAPDQGTCAHE
jgi:hypothetical protein